MAKCHRCGAETSLYVSDVSICVRCDDFRENDHPAVLGLGKESTEGPVLHAPGTGNFKCSCGLRLSFGNERGSMELLRDFRREGDRKIGECPKCGRIHEVALNETRDQGLTKPHSYEATGE